MRRTLGSMTAALALVAALAGCSTGGGEAASGGMGVPLVEERAAQGGDARADEGGAEAGAGGGSAADARQVAAEELASDRQVITTASASVAVDDPAAASAQVSELVESVGGRVEGRSEHAASPEEGDSGWAELVTRVPADELTGVLTSLGEIGEVADVSVTSSDVTTEAVDLDARISALETSVGRLQALMDGAATTTELLEAEKALSQRQAELESLQSRRAVLASQVDLSTLTVSLHPEGLSPSGGPGGFLDGLTTGWRSLGAAMGASLVVLGVVLPWVALFALITAAALPLVRWSRRRRRPAAADPVT